MSKQVFHPATIATALLCLLNTPLLFSQNEIIENPQGAVKLRRIWYKLGGNHIPLVGTGAGPLGDINDDGFDDFAVRIGTEWQVFLGGDPAPQNEPVWIFDSANYPGVRIPVVGDFFGNGDTLIGFCRFISDPPTNPTRGYTQLLLFETRNGTVSDTPSMIWDAGVSMDPPVQTYPRQMLAVDLDRNGNDELIIVLPVIGRDERSTNTEIWIFRGGAQFSLDEPTLIIRDTEPNDDNGVSLGIADCDADGFIDIMLGVNYRSIPKLKFWWGDEGSPWNWNDSPDRVLELPANKFAPEYKVPTLMQDLDGDSIQDFVSVVYAAAGTVVWRSNNNTWNARTRPFDSTDYDLLFPGMVPTRGFGYVGDSTERYATIALLRSDQSNDLAYGFAGGRNGPNATYDVYFGGGDGPGFGGVSAGDINGDGWEDRILATESYGGPGIGAAAIITGGPYIPNDDPTVSVRSEPIAGDPAGLFLWPNPVRDELHIAWKGNLERMPASIAVHNAGGQLVSGGTVQTWRGEAIWKCAEAPAGCYLVTVLDSEESSIVTILVVKE